jgi:7-cyano-7-deazaguanine synthase in queuosine biosynthesis
MPAFCHGEQRIRIHGLVAPEVLDGMRTAMGWIRHWWYEPSKQLVKIEADIDRDFGMATRSRRTAMFFSGGIDSLAALRTNRLMFSKDHPWYIRDGLIVFGLETDQEDSFQHVLEAVAGPSEDAGLTLIPIYTNARFLDADWMFWEKKSQDSIFASISYALTKRISDVVFASTYDIPSMQPAGTHPLLDLAYSSSQLTIHHDNISISRLEKVKLIAEWEMAFQNIRTCNQSQSYESGRLNCGQCIKCIRTMLELEALGLLERNHAFPQRRLTPKLVAPVIEIYKTTVDFFRELINPLRDRNRHDLADIIQEKIDEYQSLKQWKDLKFSLKAIAKRYDHKYLNGNIYKFRKILQPAPSR